ncbi:hypothetical protein [Segeticoccus rhizosphaerae]|uniref:hypothetical protein n=1 Tax=Segeticoccus rhizosphaerae TaxID=1104777 RepID=UPI0010C01935|nr:hypothetical protein [Ornithinicoccus soli]
MALLLVGVSVSSACSGGDAIGGSSTTPSTTTPAPTTIADPPSPSNTPAAPSPTSSRTASGPKAVAKANARKVLERYFQVHDACMNRPEQAKMSCFDEVTIGTQRRNNRNGLSNAKAYDIKQIGKLKVISVKPVKVDLTNEPKQQPPVIPTVVFEVCYDVSKVNIVDGNGKSLVTADRINHGRTKFSVYDYDYPDQSQWRVGYSADPVKDSSC